MDNEQNEQENLLIWNQPLDTLDDVQRCLHFLISYVSKLEANLEKFESSSTPPIRKLEYRIGKLFVKELSGTLNIGITSIDKGVDITDLGSITEDDLIDSEENVHSESWCYDEGWFNDPSNSVPR